MLAWRDGVAFAAPPGRRGSQLSGYTVPTGSSASVDVVALVLSRTRSARPWPRRTRRCTRRPLRGTRSPSLAHERQHLVDVDGRRSARSAPTSAGRWWLAMLHGRGTHGPCAGRRRPGRPSARPAACSASRELAPLALLRELEHAQDLVVVDDRRVQGGELAPVVHTLGAAGLGRRPRGTTRRCVRLGDGIIEAGEMRRGA